MLTREQYIKCLKPANDSAKAIELYDFLIEKILTMTDEEWQAQFEKSFKKIPEQSVKEIRYFIQEENRLTWFETAEEASEYQRQLDKKVKAWYVRFLEYYISLIYKIIN